MFNDLIKDAKEKSNLYTPSKSQIDGLKYLKYYFYKNIDEKSRFLTDFCPNTQYYTNYGIFTK